MAGFTQNKFKYAGILRFYNPSVGKWMSRDPLGEAGGINLYGFVGNNPANFNDPFGLYPGQRFRTKEKAAIDAINYFNPLAQNVGFEYGGWVMEDPATGQFYYDYPLGGDDPSHTDMGLKPKGAAASWHIHPCASDNIPGYFSVGDTIFNWSTEIPGFIGTPDQIKMNIPSSTISQGGYIDGGDEYIYDQGTDTWSSPIKLDSKYYKGNGPWGPSSYP